MRPIFITLQNSIDLIVIPDAQVHLNGNSVLTTTYSIFRNNGSLIEQHDLTKKQVENYFGRRENELYLGSVHFDLPGHIFTYAPNGDHRLTTDHLEELIEAIIEYRESPSKWER